ncbi:uncharacterized protein LOC111635085 isoform X2 [Centruroides sculpturatus]|nr:uncharacterized protein LOC111635085 isoform X2 [Centruroides sculpturatus]XP_023235717.1 uncharacterized protein LOC111635085 isoform X2 [Centruroides sculpturatus]
MCRMWRFVLLLGSVLTVGVNLAEAEKENKYEQSSVFGVWAPRCCTGPQPPRFNGLTDKQILDYLVDKTRYDERMRPQELTIVNVTVLILSLSSPDESSLVSF